MFSPKWKKDAQHLLKGAKKFVDYKRDRLKPEAIGEIESRRQDLKNAIKANDQAKVAESSKQLQLVCERSLPREKPLGWLEENVEVMFVAIVIALGLRAYYLQPFRIPTGSMQPTLNGIIGTPLAEKDWPSLPSRTVQKVTRGSTYVRLVTDSDRRIAMQKDRSGNWSPVMGDTQFLNFFSRSQIQCVDGPPIKLPAPLNPCMDIGLNAALSKAMISSRQQYGFLPNEMPKVIIPRGTVLCEGVINSGDLVLVDKFTYHFRKPTRGEVFVFNTIGIEGTKKNPGGSKQGGIAAQEDATHYIKRLGGVPGDTLSLAPPHLLIDGKIAREPGFENVYKMPLYRHPGQTGYSFASPGGSSYPPLLVKPGDKLELKGKDAKPGMREYAALGDNSGNSLDSRYWGTVKEFNLVGPALFSLWPFTSGHWGFIR